MSKYIVVKEREEINPLVPEEKKEYEKIDSLSIVNSKEKENIEVVSVSNKKEKTPLSSPIINNKKEKLPFSPLIIEEEKISTKLPTYNEEIQKSKIYLSSQLSEKKKNFSIETVVTKTEKKSPTFSPLKIDENKDSKSLNIISKTESKKNVSLDTPAKITSKTSEKIDVPSSFISKTKEPIFADITESKDKKDLSYEYELIQKQNEDLSSSVTESKSTKELDTYTFEIERGRVVDTSFETVNKEDQEIENDIIPLEKKVDDLKELLGINGNLTQDQKDQIDLLIPAIDTLYNGKQDPNKKIEEKRKKDWWDKAKDFLEEILGFNLEVATLKSLLMPPELDKILSDIKTFKGNIAHGEIIDATVNGFNLTNNLYNNLSHLTFGEIVGVYTANFFTITGFKPSFSIKNPRKSQFGNDKYEGGVLISSDDPFGSIEDEGNITFRKAGRFTDLRGLKIFGLTQIGNLFKRIKIKYNKDRWKRDDGNVKADDIKSNLVDEIPENASIFGIEGDGLNFGGFDPAIRAGDWENLSIKLGDYSGSETISNLIKNIQESGLDLESLKEGELEYLKAFGINKIKGLIKDFGNSKADSVKKANEVKLLTSKQFNVLKAIGISDDKLRSKLLGLVKAGGGKTDPKDLEDLFEKAGYTKEQLAQIKARFGYDIPTANSPEDVPIINLNLGSEMREGDLNTLRRSIQENFLSVQNRNNYDIGYMIIEPADFRGKSKDSLQTFKIDFEFNPEIDEGSLKANYDRTTILNRIGQLETYIGTDSITPSMKLQYRVLSRDNKKGNSWMSKWTLDYIQQIEMALRSLTVPASIENRTTRPPVIRIELGPFSNLFKFPILKNQEQRWRYFIATDVKINKFYDGSSYYLDDGMKKDLSLYARDTMGFDADISLTEVKKSYFTYYPNFNDYYDSVIKNSNKDSLQNFVYNGVF